MTSASSISKPLSSDAVQARRLADRAVDVGDGAAGAAHHVVVVVADPRLVARHRARRLDPADQPCGRQRVQRVVDGLVRDIGQIGAYGPDDRLGVGVRVGVHGDQDRRPRPGHAQPCVPQHLDGVRG